MGGTRDQQDKVKEKASDALESVKEVVQTQLLKLHLRKLEGEVEAERRIRVGGIRSLRGRHASSSSDLERARGARRDAAAVEAKKSEIVSAGADDDADEAVS